MKHFFVPDLRLDCTLFQCVKRTISSEQVVLRNCIFTVWPFNQLLTCTKTCYEQWEKLDRQFFFNKLVFHFLPFIHLLFPPMFSISHHAAQRKPGAKEGSYSETDSHTHETFSLPLSLSLCFCQAFLALILRIDHLSGLILGISYPQSTVLQVKTQTQQSVLTKVGISDIFLTLQGHLVDSTEKKLLFKKNKTNKY